MLATHPVRSLRRLWRRLDRALLGHLPRAIVFVGHAGAAAAGLTGLVLGFPAVVASIEAWNRDYVVRRTGVMAGKLFVRLVEERRLSFDRKTGRLDLSIDCGLARAELGPAADEDRHRLTNQLCDSDLGTAILGEARAWNRNLSMLAVRDDHLANGGDGACENGAVPVTFIPQGCRPSAWRLGLATAADASVRDATPLDASMAEPPAAEIHGYLARPALPGFGDWSRFDAAALGAAPAVLATRFPAEPGDRVVTIDVIGTVDAVALDGRRIEPQTQLLCHRGRSEDECRRILRRNGRSPHAYRLRLPIPGNRAAQVAIRVRAIPVVPIVLSDLGEIEEDTRTNIRTTHLVPDETVRLTSNIVLACQIVSIDDYDGGGVVGIGGRSPPAAEETPKPRKFCEPSWNASRTAGRIRPGVVRIDAAGGTAALPLTEIRQQPVEPGRGEAGLPEMRSLAVPNAEAVRLGLLPVVGLGEADRYSLLGQAVRRVPAGEAAPTIALTINPELQRIAHARLSEALGPGRPWTEPFRRAFVEGAGTARRGVAVLIDAGAAVGGAGGGGYDADAGRVLAAATWPQPPAALVHQWDILASDGYRPTESPLAARAWSQNDVHYQPGSTFKPLIGLAAIGRAARGETRFLRALGLGPGNAGLAEAEIPAVFGKDYGFGYRATELAVPIGEGEKTHPITNSGETPLCHMAILDPQKGCPKDGRIGLRPAIRTSSNLYFSRLALLVDAESVVRTAPDGRAREISAAEPDGTVPPLRIAEMARRLVPAHAFDLAPGLAQRLGGQPDPGSRLSATPIQIDAVRADRPRRLTLALAGIGQAAQATPLAMASIMASIATGRIVRPRITPEAVAVAAPSADGATEAAPGDGLFDERPAPGATPIQPALLADLLSGLRGALHDVVLGGTARLAFAKSPLRDRVYGKTGTAQVAQGVNSVWFVGWIDGLGQRRWRNRRLAFACLVSHVQTEGDAAAGGRICAPIIEKVLSDYERSLEASADPGAGR